MNKYFLKPVLLITLTTFISCNKNHEEQSNNQFNPLAVEAKAYKVPKDSIADPLVIPVDESKLKKTPAGKPNIITANINVHPAGAPKVVIAGTPKAATPGQGNYTLPKSIPAIDSPFVAGLPEMVTAKDAYSKDQNSQNFSSFGKLQGLNHSMVICMIEDKSGNLWFGTRGGGVSKYDGKSFTHYTQKEGLSNNSVWSILEDKSGNLWFGTENGSVTKFDGMFFTHYNEMIGLKNYALMNIMEDKSGNIWFGTDGGGVYKYDGQSFTHFSEKEGLGSDAITDIIEDKNGNIWFGTINGGVSQYDGKSFKQFTQNEGLSNNNVWSIMEDRSGKIWIGSWGSGITKYDGKYFSHFTDKEGLSSNYISSIWEDKNGLLWFGTQGGGVTKYDGKSFTHFTEKEGLLNNVVFSVLEDKGGNMWFGVRGGLAKYGGKTFTHFTEKEGLSNKMVISILEDRGGKLWFGTRGGGVSAYDGISISQYTEMEGLSNNVIKCISEDKNGNIWLGTEGGGVTKYDGTYFTHFTKNDGLSSNSVTSVIEDKTGNIWFGTYGGGVAKYDNKSFTHFTEKEGLSNNHVLCIYEDKTGNIWFGTEGGGLTKFDGVSFYHFNENGGMSNNTILSILEDSGGNLWFGTEGGGVSKYDGNKFTHFTEKEGLSNNYVLSILEDHNGDLWFGTRFGLSNLSYSKLSVLTDKANTNEKSETNVIFKNYTYEDGFLGIGCYVGSIFESKNGTIWVGANDRLTAYQPPKHKMQDTIAPNIQLNGLQLFNEKISWVNFASKSTKSLGESLDTSIVLGNGVRVKDFKFKSISKWYGIPENLSLAHYNNYLTFNYIGITLNSPKKVKYKYRLDGIDKSWSAITNRTEAPYGNLPHGTYKFRVKAMNGEGYWSKEYTYTFSIRPPWWKTYLAYSLYFITLTGSIWFYIRWRERALKIRQVELEKMVTERTAEVVAEKLEVEKQKKRSEDLLLNILPSEVAEELMTKGSAEAKQFDEVTVMFTDFKGFTQISEKLSPAELVNEIHTCFKAFDNIITKYNIEKIKTIGDSYMCAGGLPVANTTNACDVVNAALEIQHYMVQHLLQRKEEGKALFEIRIGIHTGPVVAGIVGAKKFAYDIWGDTVNIASRMESSGETGKVNVSGSTYELIKDKFICSYRGKIQAKNKGEIDMYFVER